MNRRRIVRGWVPWDVWLKAYEPTDTSNRVDDGISVQTKPWNGMRDDYRSPHELMPEVLGGGLRGRRL